MPGMQPLDQKDKLKRGYESGISMETALDAGMDIDEPQSKTSRYASEAEKIVALNSLFSLISSAKKNDLFKMSDKLQSLIAEYYPHYAGLEYIQIEVLSQSGDKKTVRYRCKLVLFDMVLECREIYDVWEEAKEAVAKIGYELLKEFNNTIQMRMTDGRFERLFKPLVDEMTCRLSAIKTDESEEQKKALGLPGILSVDRYKQTDSLPQQQSVLSPLLSAIFTKMNAPGTTQLETQTADKGTSVEPLAKKPATEKDDTSLKEEAADPVMILQEHYQKMSATSSPPAYDFFERRKDKKLYYGCKASYQGNDYIVEANYNTKKEAKKAVAGQICNALFGKSLDVAEVSDAIVSNGPKDFVYANSNKILANSSAPVTTSTVQIGASSLTVMQQAPTKLSPASAKSTLGPLPDGRKYVSVVNEFCQYHKIGQPNYQFQTGDSITTFYIAHVDNPFTPANIQRIGKNPDLDNEPVPEMFVSVACSRKNDAKEDCAMRVYEFMLKQNWVDQSGKRQDASIRVDNGRRSSRYYSTPFPPASPYPIPNRNFNQMPQQHQQQNSPFMPPNPSQFMQSPPPHPFFPPPLPTFNPNSTNPQMSMSAPPFMPPFPFPPPPFMPQMMPNPQQQMFPSSVPGFHPHFPIPPLPGQSLANTNALISEMRKNSDPRLKKQYKDP